MENIWITMKLWDKLSIHPITYILILVVLLTGLFKYFLIISCIIIIHELGHIVIAKIFKRKIVSVCILPFGGLIKMDGFISEDISEDLLIAVGGILFQLILGFLIFFIKTDLKEIITFYNTLIIGFNLLPICPLDGYKMVKLMSELFIPFKRTFSLGLFISGLTLIIYAILNWNLILDNTLIFGFLIFMSYQEFCNKKHILNRFYLERMNRDFSFPLKMNIKKLDEMYKNRENIMQGMREHEFIKEAYYSKKY